MTHGSPRDHSKSQAPVTRAYAMETLQVGMSVVPAWLTAKKEKQVRVVYVLDMDGNPLMPTDRYGKVRRMLKSGEARPVDWLPFTIRLTRPTKTHVVQPVTLGCDPGRTNIGLAAVRSDGTDLYRSHCETRNKEIVKRMNDRRGFRRASRRGARLARKRLAKRLGTTRKFLEGRMLPGCEEPLMLKDIINTEARFNNRLRPEGWMTPSARQLLQTHLNLIRLVAKILPVSDLTLEINRFAFMQLDQPGKEKHEIDFRRGPLYGTGGLEAAVRKQQENTCLLCKAKEIEHFHHIIPRSRRGSNTIENIAGLCGSCHEKVHKSKSAAEKLSALKEGLKKRYGGTSVLNQIIPKLVEELTRIYPEHLHLTYGWSTKEFRKKHHMGKTHDTDAYCIAAGTMGPVSPTIRTEVFEIRQFRRHDRANIHHRTERVYKLDGKTVAKNRRKRMDQKTDSLEEWFESMAEKYGRAEAEALRSRLMVQKSTRHYNAKGRQMPGMVFLYKKERYVMTGQLTGGAYYRAYGKDKTNFPAKKVRVVRQNAGLVYMA